MTTETLACIARPDEGERVVVRWLGDGQRHHVELAVERRAVDGWALRRRVVVRLSELYLVADGLARASDRAREVRR